MRFARAATACDDWGMDLSIRTRLLLLLLVLVVPFTIYFLLVSVREAQTERELAGAQMLSAARMTAARLDDHVGDIRQVLRVLTAVVGTDPADIARNDLLLQSLRDQLPPHINNISVWTAEGQNVGTIDIRLRAKGVDATQRQFFRDAIRGVPFAVEAPVVSVSNGALVGIFAIPISRAGQVVGVVAASAQLTTLQSILAPSGSLPDGAVVAVTDPSGIVLARSIDPEKWIGRNLIRSGLGQVEASQKLREGVRDGASADGTPRVAGFMTANLVPWLVYVGVPRSTALASVYERLREDLIVVALLMFVGGGLALWIGNGISTPLRIVGADAERLGRGELTHRTRIRQGGEIGKLAATLDQMAAALQDRTRLLEESQNELRLITDNLPVLIARIDEEQRFRFANRAYRDWLGVDPTALIGKSLEEVFGEPAYLHMQAHVESALAGSRVVYERDLTTPAGLRHLEVTAVPDMPDGRVRGLFVVTNDVTASRASEARRARSEERLSLALEASGLALFDWDLRANLLYHSAQAAAMRGDSAHEVTADPRLLETFVHPDDRDAMSAKIVAALRGDVALYDAEFRVSTTTPDRWIWLRAMGRVVEHDASGRALRLAGTYADITERKAVEARLRQMAEYDALTGLPNRALFHDRLTQAIARTHRQGSKLALLFLDIDHFKAVNDTLGHEAGDDVLRSFARGLCAGVRASDTVARLGGDEFTVILEDISSLADARRIAQTLVESSRRRIGSAAIAVEISTSIGVAMLANGVDDAASVLQRADGALYEAKRLGRDRHAVALSVEPEVFADGVVRDVSLADPSILPVTSPAAASSAARSAARSAVQSAPRSALVESST